MIYVSSLLLFDRILEMSDQQREQFESTTKVVNI